MSDTASKLFEFESHFNKVTGDLSAALQQFQLQSVVQAREQADNKALLTTILQALHIAPTNPISSQGLAASADQTEVGQQSASSAKANPLTQTLNQSDKGAAVSHTQHQSGLIWDNGKNRFGDSISKKGNNILRIEFQNKGGMSFQKDYNKNNTRRSQAPLAHERMVGFMPPIIQSHRATKIDHRQQFGSVALLSLNKSSHRVIRKGIDTMGLGRWSWTRYRGKNNLTLCIIVAYRPNPPAGPFTVAAQYREYFTSIGDSHNSCIALQMLEGGYFNYDEVFPNTDHRCLWLDLSFVNAFGHNMPSIVRTLMWCLHCKDPQIMNIYCSHLRGFVVHHKLRESL